MIRVERCDEPADFDVNVRQAGLRWLREKLGGERAPRRGRPVEPVANLRSHELEDYWTRALPDMRRLYGGVCAYAGIEIREGGETVDHFESKARCLEDATLHPLIYDWANYRYAFHRINASKGERRVLDPFAVESDWFTLEPVGLTVIPREGIADELRVQVNETIRALGLNEPWLVRLRMKYFDDWSAGDTSSGYLRRYAPFIAREIERQGIVPEVAPT